MRGKLRDKRATARRDISRREGTERTRPAKRDNRAMARLHLQLEDDDLDTDLEDEEESEDEDKKIEVPQKK